MSEANIKKEEESDEKASSKPDVETTDPSSDEDGKETSDKSKGETTPHVNDVLCGRGGSINTHPGNENYRRLVESKKRIYLTARFKREKRLIADSIISEIRGLDPPGRFLSRDVKTGLWHDIGNEKARDKASQALRVNAPLIRREMESENDQKRVEQMRREMEDAARSAGGHHYHPGYYSSTGSHYPYDKYNSHYSGAQPHYEQPVDQQGHPNMDEDRRKSSFSMSNFGSAFSSFTEWPKSGFGAGTQHPQAQEEGPAPRASNTSNKAPQRLHHHMSSTPQPTISRAYSAQYRHHTEKRSVSFHSTDMVCNYDASADNHNMPPEGMQQPYQQYPQHQGEGHSAAPYQAQSLRAGGRRSFSPTPSLQRRPSSSSRYSSHYQDDLAARENGGQYRNTKRRSGTHSPGAARHHHHPQDKPSYGERGNSHYRQSGGFNSAAAGAGGTASTAYTSSHHHNQSMAPEAALSSAAGSHNKIHQKHDSYAQGSSMPPSEDKPNSLLSQVAQRILSFDSASMPSLTSAKQERDVVSKSLDLCGSSSHHNPTDKQNEEFKLMPPPQQKPQQRTYQQQQQGTSEEQEVVVEEEGTEVALVDLMECEEEEDVRTPPPESPIMGKPQVEIDWSSKVGGCHTWIQESITGGVGALPGIVQCGTEGGKPVDHLSPAHSMEMDCYSLSGTDVYSQGGSLNGSVGGGSLCNVFDADALSGNGSSHGPQDNPSVGTFRSQQERSQHMSAAYQRAEQYVTQVAKRGVHSSNSKDGGLLAPIAYSNDSEPFEPTNERIEPMDDFMWSWDGKSRE